MKYLKVPQKRFFTGNLKHITLTRCKGPKERRNHGPKLKDTMSKIFGISQEEIQDSDLQSSDSIKTILE